jgi:(R,R)-butanediol dehydrogenase/meso-butanediol dehydrogenase/diacetyl reductase
VQAVVLRGPRALALETLPDPRAGPGELVLRVEACGVCGSDLSLWKGGLVPAGSVLGHEFCGEVMEAAEGFRTGERVCALPALSCGRCRRCRSGLGAYCEKQRTIGMGTAPGAFAEYVAVAAHECVRLPNGVDAVHGALVEPLAVALHAVRIGRVRRADHVLVLGGGPIGLGAMLWARHFGAREIVVCERLPRRREIAEELGASVTATPDELERALTLALPNGPSVVIEAVGAPGLIQRALELVRFRGRVVVTGVCFGPDTIVPLPALTREVSVQFALAYEKDDFQYTVDALASGRIAPLPMATGRQPLAAIPAAFERLAEPGDHCKVLYVA